MTVVIELLFDNIAKQHVGPFDTAEQASAWLNSSKMLPYFKAMYVQVSPEEWQAPVT